MAAIAQTTMDMIGNTPLLRIHSLSELSGHDIFIKAEFLNPGGSIKDRAAKQMVLDAIESGRLKPGMTIVEGTAGNTGIGLAVVAKSLGFDLVAVMPKGQTAEKERMIELFGAKLKLAEAVAFKDERHFFHTAKNMALEDPKKYWWANQFDNLSNHMAHYKNTAPEIFKQLDGDLDYLVSVAGTGGTIAGHSKFFKEKCPKVKVHLIDPDGSGLFNYFKHGEFKSSGSSFTEGIGTMRLVENFKQAQVDDVFNFPDRDIVTLAEYVRDQDGLILGSSSALNVAGAFYTALKAKKKSRIVTFACDLGERSFSKLWNKDFLKEKGIGPQTITELREKYAKT
jgi:cysteine synthase